MAEKSLFFDSIAGDRVYNSKDFTSYFKKILTNGVFNTPTDNLQVVSNGNLTVTVKSGMGNINGYLYISDTDKVINIPTPSATVDRTDSIVMRFDLSQRKITTEIKQGDTVPQRDNLIYELILATILVTKGTSSITTGNITDKRSDLSVCGYINNLSNEATTLLNRIIATENNITTINTSLTNVIKKSFDSGNTKICTNAYMIKPEYEGFTGVIDTQTINLPSGFKVGLRHQLTYDNNNHIITLYDTQQNITYQASYNGTTWTTWARLFNSNGGETSNDITVVKNDGYVKVKDLSGNIVGMHTNGGNGWVHLFNSSGIVVNGIDLLSSGKVLANGEPVNKKPFVKVYQSTVVTIPAGNGTTKNILNWDNLLISDPPYMGANPGTTANLVAPITGLYQIDCTIEVGGGPGGSKGVVKCELSKNNSEFISASDIVYETGNQTLHLSGSYLLKSGEYVQVHLYNYCNFPISLFTSRRFEMTYVRGWDL